MDEGVRADNYEALAAMARGPSQVRPGDIVRILSKIKKKPLVKPSKSEVICEGDMRSGFASGLSYEDLSRMKELLASKANK